VFAPCRQIIYEDAGALENEGLDDATLSQVLRQDAGGASGEAGPTGGLSYEQVRLNRMRAVAAMQAVADEAQAAAASREDEDAGSAAPLFDFE
jgi:hypothetical protein